MVATFFAGYAVIALEEQTAINKATGKSKGQILVCFRWYSSHLTHKYACLKGNSRAEGMILGMT